MSLLTITKLTDTVGAEVTGLDPAALASDDPVGEAILDALEDNGVLVFRGLQLDPEAQVAFCRRLGEVDHSSDGHHPVAGIYPITLDKSKNSSAAYLKATFDWHIDGCTPLGDEYPQKATVLSAVQVAEWGGETEFANSYAAYDTLSDEEKDRFGTLRVVHSLEASQRRVTPTPPRAAGALAVPAHPRASAGVDAPQRPQVAGAGRLRRLRGRHGPRRGSRAAGRAARARHRARQGLQPHLVGRRHRHLGQPRGAAPRRPLRPRLAREMLRTTVLGDEPIQ